MKVELMGNVSSSSRRVVQPEKEYGPSTDKSGDNTTPNIEEQFAKELPSLWLDPVVPI